MLAGSKTRRQSWLFGVNAGAIECVSYHPLYFPRPSPVPTDYQPVACGFYDALEAAATCKQPVYLQYFNDLRQLCQESVAIKTFVTRDHA